MNKKLFCLILAFSIPLSAYAEPGSKGGGKDWHAKKMERMVEQLKLTDEQKPQVEAIFKEQHAKIKVIREESRSQLEKVLTQEQIAKLDEMKKNRKEKHKKKKKQ